jgi:hypothetical protein
MDKNEAKKIVDYVFKDVFELDNPFTLEESLKAFASDIPLPKEFKSTFNRSEITWGDFKKDNKVASQSDMMARSAKDEFMKPKEEIKSMDQLLKRWDDINLYTGERYLDSQDVAESDGVYSSTKIYRSQLQFNSQYMVYCYNNRSSKYLLASRDNFACTNGIRYNQANYVSSSYEVLWSSKVSKSMFSYGCFDLYECMFCNNIRSKKYCIGNMQYEKEEYMNIKGMVIKWLMGELNKKAK